MKFELSHIYHSFMIEPEDTYDDDMKDWDVTLMDGLEDEEW